jgi:ABC-type glycerol-3-phosphate transport system substrate-binding protein
MRRLALLAACAIALLGAGCGENKSTSSSPATTTAAGNRVTELEDIAQLRAAFNAHPGVPRLIVLASPT